LFAADSTHVTIRGIGGNRVLGEEYIEGQEVIETLFKRRFGGKEVREDVFK
jgi:hypothetical protein